MHYQCGSSIGVPLTGNFTATTLGLAAPDLAVPDAAVGASVKSAAPAKATVEAASPSVAAASTLSLPLGRTERVLPGESA